MPKECFRCLVTFVNDWDYISLRHHTYKLVDGWQIELKEAEPCFKLKLHKINFGTVDAEDVADVEWVLKPYMNTARKRQALSDREAFPGIADAATTLAEGDGD